MRNVHAISVKYMGATNYRGSRVKMTSLRFNSSVTINYNYELNNIYDMAKIWLEGKGYTCESLSETKAGYIINVNEFIDIRKV